jgi:hypothetical protein
MTSRGGPNPAGCVHDRVRTSIGVIGLSIGRTPNGALMQEPQERVLTKGWGVRHYEKI